MCINLIGSKGHILYFFVHPFFFSIRSTVFVWFFIDLVRFLTLFNLKIILQFSPTVLKSVKVLFFSNALTRKKWRVPTAQHSYILFWYTQLPRINKRMWYHLTALSFYSIQQDHPTQTFRPFGYQRSNNFEILQYFWFLRVKKSVFT